MKEIVIQIKGQIEDDVSTVEVENAIYDNLPVDIKTAIIESVISTTITVPHKQTINLQIS